MNCFENLKEAIGRDGGGEGGGVVGGDNGDAGLASVG